MDLYKENKAGYVAPCTSLVTSSLMGKTRLMKELANYGPTVYICLRKSNEYYGYPERSPLIADFMLAGFEQIEKGRSMDLKVIIAEKSCLLSTIKFSAIMEATIEELATWIRNKQLQKAVGVSETDNFQYTWLWQFFAEPERPEELKRFWESVITKTLSIIETGAKDPKIRNRYGESYVLCTIILMF